jgi:hypothetical protein
MATLNKGKHLVIEIDNVSCSLVEKTVEKDRLDFLKSLLELNGYEVKVMEEPKEENSNTITYTIGVTDLLFNPVIDVYKRRLRSNTGHKVTPAFWLQKSVAESEAEVNYWKMKY